MNYEEAIKVLVNSDRDEYERGDILIREMCRVVEDILNYRYITQHSTNEAVKEDKKATIKNSIAVMLGDLDVYMSMLGITENARSKAEERVIKIAQGIEKRKAG